MEHADGNPPVLIATHGERKHQENEKEIDE
jgi:hypothetical protein